MRTTLRRSLHVGLALGAVSLVARLGVGVLSFEAGSATLEGCSLTATDGGVLIKSQTKYQAGSATTLTSTGTYNGETIKVFNQNGSLKVIGDAGGTSVSLSAVAFAFADNQDDGTAAITDVQSTIKIDQSQSGTISVNCSVAVNNHNSAKNGTTGCDLTVHVPAGTTTSPLTFSAHAANGPATVQGLTMSDSNIGSVKSDNGDVTVSVNGSCVAHSSNGQVSATIVSQKGSTVEASSDNGDVTLGIPAGFSADKLTLSASGGTVTIGSGFTNTFTATSTSVGTAGTGAVSVTATTGLGNVTVTPSG
ncbi:MAG TPA: hypothetical protein VIF15_01680 [Polyangiaceae bacterium]|jgi:hypothetical protein